jgi:hypothetical protein
MTRPYKYRGRLRRNAYRFGADTVALLFSFGPAGDESRWLGADNDFRPMTIRRLIKFGYIRRDGFGFRRTRKGSMVVRILSEAKTRDEIGRPLWITRPELSGLAAGSSYGRHAVTDENGDFVRKRHREGWFSS